MLPPVPDAADYGITKEHGFLPAELPLEKLPDSYYTPWEDCVSKLQPLLLNKRLRDVIQKMPVLSTAHLKSEPEWRRAYSLLVFMMHGYIWGGDVPAERVPQPITIPLLTVTSHLELPPVATYAGLCLWNFKPLFSDETLDINNLAMLTTFTGSLDEAWFYQVSVAIEAHGAPLIPLMLEAMRAARNNSPSSRNIIIDALQQFAERVDEIGGLFERMYENCDPHVFYHRIRPFLAGSKNMADAGLPNGVIYEDGTGTETYQQYGGGSNAQSSLIQFFDIVLGVSHRPTGSAPANKLDALKTADNASRSPSPQSPPTENNFIHDMRSYMPGPHARFLSAVSACANIRSFVTSHPDDRTLTVAYDACLAMLRALRDKHIRMVSRYIVVKSREGRGAERSLSPRAAPRLSSLNIATGTQSALSPGAPHHSSSSGDEKDTRPGRSKMRGTGGTALIPFLKQARDETGEPAVDGWARRLLGDKPLYSKRRAPSISISEFGGRTKADVGISAGSGMGLGDGGVEVAKGVMLSKWGEHADGVVEVVGLAGTWSVEESEGGLCHW